MPVIDRKFKPCAFPARQPVWFAALFGLVVIASLSPGCQRSGATRQTAPPAGQVSATPRASQEAASDSPVTSVSPSNPSDLPQIVAFGDSLTAGLGLSPSQSYPALLQKRLDDQGYRYRVINAGVSGDTSADGVRRIDWTLKGDVRFLILELGANDALRGQPVAEMKKNLGQIIERAQSRQVTVILAGMEAPPNYGDEYPRDFRSAFPGLARQYHAKLIPFFLGRVGGLAEYNQADGMHPNAEGTEIVMENVWRVLEPLLAK